MKNKRLICTLLLLSMLTSAFSACGAQEKDATTTTAVTTAESVGTSEESTSDPLPDNLPPYDFQGYEFIIYTDTVSKDYYDFDTEDGDIVHDSIYQRNSTVEERYNVKITAADSSAETIVTHTQSLAKNIMAGDSEYDITAMHSVYGASLTLEGLFHNLYDIDYLDFTQPWWYPQTVEELTFMKKMYLACSAISYSALSTVTVDYINMKMYEDYALSDKFGSIYDIVTDGKWTLDTLSSITKNIYSDLNGNGEKDYEDLYGYMSVPNREGLWTAFDVPMYEKSEDGLKAATANDKIVDIINKMYDLLYDSDSTLLIQLFENGVMNYISRYAEKFSNDTVMIIEEGISLAASNLRDMESDYGIIPMPKYDEAQQNYRCFAEGSYFSVPITNNELERTGIIIEALTAEGYKQIQPAYLQVALKEKFLRDEQSKQMLDIVVKSYTASFAFDYDEWAGFAHLFGKIFTEKKVTTDVASYMEKNYKKAQSRADKIAEGFANN